MKVLEKAKTPDGEKIQIEEWNEDYPRIYPYGALIAAFPKKSTGCTYRAECEFESSEKAKAAFELLKAGDKSLDDFHFTSMKSGKAIPFREYAFNY